MYDVAEKYPEGYQDIVSELVDNFWRETDLDLESAKSPFWVLLQYKGKPEVIGDIRSIWTSDIKTKIEDMSTSLDIASDGINRFDGWNGKGANAFKEYLPSLFKGLSALAANCDDISDALKSQSDGLTALWSKILEQIGDVAASVTSLVGELEATDDDAVKAGKKKSIAGAFDEFTGWVLRLATSVIEASFNIWAAKEIADSNAIDTVVALNDALKVPGLMDLGQPYYDDIGPRSIGGYQIPMPGDEAINSEWSDDKIKDKWDGDTSVDFDLYMEFVNGLKKTKGEWKDMVKSLYKASNLAQSDVFGEAIGYGVYTKYHEITVARDLTFGFSDERFVEFSELMRRVAEAYGEADKDSSTEIEGVFLENE